MENPLLNQVKTYLETWGDRILEIGDDYLVADAIDWRGKHKTKCIWVPVLPEGGVSSLERPLLRRFRQDKGRYPEAEGCLIVHTLEGFSQTFRDQAGGLGVALSVPVQFFDTEFKYEAFPELTKSALRALREPFPRIPQPYTVLADGEGERGDDLLETLRSKYLHARNASLRIVVGPAGVGKTWFFKKLFSDLYDAFVEQKQRLRTFPRPIPLCPEIRQRRGVVSRMGEIINEFLESDELVRRIPRSTFEWMLVNGYALWLFDGFDEVYARDERFFDDIADLLTCPDSKAQILICARESLISSCAAFAEFLENYPPGRTQEPAIELYRLDRWESPSKRKFAELHIDDETRKNHFLVYISRSESLKQLSSLPYYLSLLVEEFKQGITSEFSSDWALIEHSVSRIIEREKGKGVLSDHYFQPNGLDEWLETMAYEYYTTNSRGISKADAEEYAEAILSSGLPDEERQNAITALVQFPLLARGAETGLLAFEHELIAEYLVGRYWLRRLFQDPAKVAREMSRKEGFADSLLARYLAAHLPAQPGGIDSLAKVLARSGDLLGRDFAVLLQLLLAATPARDLLKHYGIAVERRDLSQLRFEGRDLSDISFRGCNLSDTVFQDCDLRGARFEGAYLYGTRFAQLPEGALKGARFGNLENFGFVYVGSQRIEDRSKFNKWLQEATGLIESIQEPCPAALQLRTLFLKFVRPDGTGRRDEMLEDALLRGKRYPDAPLPQECLEACIRFSYLQPPNWRKRVKRASGERYDEIVDFVKKWTLSDRMRAMLDELCPTKGCEHVPASYHTS
jgi:uncharacterized protein YjbI with pentapeptide repeats